MTAAPQSASLGTANINCELGGRRHFSPLEIIDQTDDDAKLLQALEGLTLDEEDAKSDNVGSQT